MTSPLPPLADLHCHLEAVTTPLMARKLAKRHAIDVSRLFTETGEYAWSTFEDFLSVYDAMARVIRTPEDYHDITADHLAAAAREGVIYAEVFVSADHAAGVGLSFGDMIAAVGDAMDAAEAAGGPIARMVATSVRHYGAAKAEAAARLAAEADHPRLTGFGIAGDEAFGAPRDFARAFDIAREAGLGLTAHAGEICGPESVRAALEWLKPARLGHGVRAIEDPSLLAELAARGVVLEVCPTSNIAIGLYSGWAAHPLPDLIKGGARVALGSDDPAFFGASIGDEYRRAGEAFAFGHADLAGITRTAIAAAFCDEPTKTGLLARLSA
ncbi:MAG: adenosine deaminase [Pseudomonadota bacterium]